jgi:hypothetical protein
MIDHPLVSSELHRATPRRFGGLVRAHEGKEGRANSPFFLSILVAVPFTGPKDDGLRQAQAADITL